MRLTSLNQLHCDALTEEYGLLLQKLAQLRLERVKPTTTPKRQLDLEVAQCNQRLEEIERKMTELGCEAGDHDKASAPITIEVSSGERFQADVPYETTLTEVAVEFFRSQNWPLCDRHGHPQRFHIGLVNPREPDQVRPLDCEGTIGAARLQEGDVIRIEVEVKGPEQAHSDSTAEANLSVREGCEAPRLICPPAYLEFDLEVSVGSGRAYPVTARSVAGEARATMQFPFDELALESRLKDVQIALLSSGGRRRRVLSSQERAVREFGQALFEALLSGEVRSRYEACQERAAAQAKGLRLRLRFGAADLAALPWEFLYDPRQTEYVCLSRNTPVIRYLEAAQPIQPLAVKPPLRVLGMIASPSDLEPLDVARERERLETALKELCVRRQVELTWLVGQGWRDLQRAMRGGPWHIFHFIGHGGFDEAGDEGIIALTGDDGRMQALRATELSRLLADQRSLRLVLLNACEGARGSQRDILSSTAATLVRRGIPAVVAMQYEITDRAAIELARAFYEALAEGYPVDAAIAEARKAISLAVANTVEWGTPVLYMRSPDGVLFEQAAG